MASPGHCDGQRPRGEGGDLEAVALGHLCGDPRRPVRTVLTVNDPVGFASLIPVGSKAIFGESERL